MALKSNVVYATTLGLVRPLRPQQFSLLFVIRDIVYFLFLPAHTLDLAKSPSQFALLFLYVVYLFNLVPS
jgi:hypothetical protein